MADGDFGTVGPLALFCARLKRLQEASDITQTSLAEAAGISTSQMSDIMKGKIKKRPNWNVTLIVVRTCLEHAERTGRPVPPDLGDEVDWRRRYFDLEQDLDAGGRPSREALAAGWQLADVTDPFALEVHRPVQPDAPQRDLPPLPIYIPREHDVELESVASAAVRGSSGIAVLVGGSSTGKTRACWEALRLLRDCPKPWRLWHPIDPSRPEAALRELPTIGPRTVVWLNEAQFYLGVSVGGLGERVAAGLREMLRDPTRAPVLVLATLWPEFWELLTSRPAAGEDPHAQARELLTGRDISVPAAFTGAELEQLAAAADPRLAQAAEAADDGQVIQFLAGVPELMARYRNARPSASALINAAIDARRLGMGVTLPLAFLEEAAPGYLTDTEWDTVGEDWLKQALTYTAAPCRGVRGPLTRIRPRAISYALPASGPAYRLADYLEQHGRHARRHHVPPASFWAAAANFASLDELPALSQAAVGRGLFRDAARLYKAEIVGGNTEAAVALVHWLHSIFPTDGSTARWVAAHAALNNPQDVAWLLDALREVGATDEVAALLAREPAAHVALDDVAGIAQLLFALQRVDADEQVQVLARRAAVQAPLDDPLGVTWLLHGLQRAEADEQVASLLAREPAAHASLDDPSGVSSLLDALRGAGADEQVQILARRAVALDYQSHLGMHQPGISLLLSGLQKADAGEQARALARRAAAQLPLEDPAAVNRLIDQLLLAHADEQVAALLAREPATHARLDDALAVSSLLRMLVHVNAGEQAQILARRAAAHAPLGHSSNLGSLLKAVRAAGADEQVQVLARRAAESAALDDPSAVAELLDALRELRAVGQVAAVLARQPAGHAVLREAFGVSWLLDALREVGATDQVAALLAREPAAHVALDDVAGIAQLLFALQRVDADEQVQVLARRAAVHAPLDISLEVADLLEALRELNADEQARLIVARMPVEGMFDDFCRETNLQMLYRFGREPDGTRASTWSWEDLD